MPTIGLLGNMNNMGYQIGKYLRKLGAEVTLFVDAPASYQLDRPESWDQDLQHQYPPWIVDLGHRRSQSGMSFILPFRWRGLVERLNRFDGVVLNGNWISLGSQLDEHVVVANFFAGADLDYCGEAYPQRLAMDRSTNPLMQRLLESYYRKLWSVQRRGIRRSNLVNYYLPGVNPDSDTLLSEIKTGQTYQRLPLRGIDCELFPYVEPKLEKPTFDILSVIRFFFSKDRVENKRNDVMIQGIGLFVRRVRPRNLRITFFTKGEDVPLAQQLCKDEGIDTFVTWVPQVRNYELRSFFEAADVAFDQLGGQWLGAGLFSMCTGRPLIANPRADLYMSTIGESPPVCSASSPEDVANWLHRLYESPSLRVSLGKACSQFVRRHYDMTLTAQFILDGVHHFQREHQRPDDRVGRPP